MKKMIAGFLTALMVLSMTACGSAGNETQPSIEPQESVAAEETVQLELPSTEGAVVRYEKFEIVRSENDRCFVFLRFRENSAYVAEVTIDMVIPAGSSEYESLLKDNQTMKADLKSGKIDASLVEFSYSESADRMTMLAKYNHLDEGHPDHVQFTSDMTDLPARNGYLLLKDCEKFLLDNEFELTDHN